jgi:hypothetical protein
VCHGCSSKNPKHFPAKVFFGLNGKITKQSPPFYIYSIPDESQGTHMGKDISRNLLLSELTFHRQHLITPYKKAWLMVKISKAYRVFEALFYT